MSMNSTAPAPAINVSLYKSMKALDRGFEDQKK